MNTEDTDHDNVVYLRDFKKSPRPNPYLGGVPPLQIDWDEIGLEPVAPDEPLRCIVRLNVGPCTDPRVEPGSIDASFQMCTKWVNQAGVTGVLLTLMKACDGLALRAGMSPPACRAMMAHYVAHAPYPQGVAPSDPPDGPGDVPS